MSEQEKHSTINPAEGAQDEGNQDVDNQNPKEDSNDVDAQAGVENEQPSPEQGLEQELEQAQAEIAKLKDGYLRAKAEEDNVRRRAEKEVANSRKFAVEGFAKELLNVHDSLKLASQIEISGEDEVSKQVVEGLEITLKQLESVFAKFAIAQVSPEAGDKLDPNLHQAMSQIESEEIESGHIINVIQAGFTLHDRLIRPAMVVVAK